MCAFANATKMADYLEQKGFRVFREGILDEDRYVDGTVFLNAITIEDGELSPTLGAHEAGAMQFAIEFLIVASHYLGLQEWWWHPNPEDLEGF